MRVPVCDPTGIDHLDRWIREVRRIVNTEALREAIHGWVADDRATALLGTLPPFSYVVGLHVQVTEAFNSDGTDFLTIGWDADPNALMDDLDVSATGVLAPVLLSVGTGAEKDIKAYYTAGGSAATTGKAIVILEYIRVTDEIS